MPVMKSISPLQTCIPSAKRTTSTVAFWEWQRTEGVKKMQRTELRGMREAAGVPRIVLADLAGVSAFRLYRAEAGRCQLTAEERAAIDRVLGPELERAAR